MLPHVPSAPPRFFALEQARQSPSQALLQQTPSTQNPLGQSEGWVHGVAMVGDSTRPMGSRKAGSSLALMALPPAPMFSAVSRAQPEAAIIVMANNEVPERRFMRFPSAVHVVSTQRRDGLRSLPIAGDTFMHVIIALAPESPTRAGYAFGVDGAGGVAESAAIGEQILRNGRTLVQDTRANAYGISVFGVSSNVGDISESAVGKNKLRRRKSGKFQFENSTRA